MERKRELRREFWRTKIYRERERKLGRDIREAAEGFRLEDAKKGGEKIWEEGFGLGCRKRGEVESVKGGKMGLLT